MFHHSLNSSAAAVSLVDFGGWAGGPITAAARKNSQALHRSAAYYATAEAGRSKYNAFVTDRFKSRDSFLAAARAEFTQTTDINFSTFRAGLWQKVVQAEAPIGVALGLHPQLFEGVASAFVSVVYDKYIK